jgi:hypothetical protein
LPCSRSRRVLSGCDPCKLRITGSTCPGEPGGQSRPDPDVRRYPYIEHASCRADKRSG